MWIRIASNLLIDTCFITGSFWTAPKLQCVHFSKIESVGSGEDYSVESLRKRLTKLRNKNTSLVTQNNKLMTELENMGYELHQEQINVSAIYF